jgi:hypothetical protein
MQCSDATLDAENCAALFRESALATRNQDAFLPGQERANFGPTAESSVRVELLLGFIELIRLLRLIYHLALSRLTTTSI